MSPKFLFHAQVSLGAIFILGFSSLLLFLVAAPAWAKLPAEQSVPASAAVQDDPVLDQFIFLPLVQRSPSGWSSQASGVVSDLFGVGCAAGGQDCQIAGRALALKTDNGGASWSPVTPPVTGLELYDVNCPTPSRCVAVGKSGSSAGLILVTNNGGASWTTFNQAYLMWSVDCISADECVVVGDESEARFTFNGGASWSDGRLGNTPLYGVDCVAAKTCWMVGVGGRVIGTYPNPNGPDGIGVIPKKDLLIKEEKSLLSISCVQQSTCVAVGEIGKIFKTTNTGGSWVERASGTGERLTGVSCPDASFCYAVGHNGTALISSDGGSSWAPELSLTAENLEAIDCFGPTNCVAVGTNGTILRRN